MVHWAIFNVLVYTNIVINHVLSTTDWHYSGENVAYDKYARQSPGTYSDWKSYPAELATDGNVNTSFYAGSCTHTSGTHGLASWTVELGKSYRIAGIIIYNREEENQRDRLRNFSVLGNYHSVIYDDSGKYLYKERKILIPITNLPWYSSITIQIPNHDGYPDYGISYLTLCEVQVFEMPKPLCDTLSGSSVRNGQLYILGNTGLRLADKNTVGTVIAFSCHDNYLLDGSAYIRCLPNGSYNASIPNCIATCSAPTIPAHGRLVPSRQTYLAGMDVKLECDEVYSPGHDQSIRCLESHVWTDNFLSCMQIYCPNPGPIQHGYYTSRKNGLFKISYYISLPLKSKVFVSCDIGYEGYDNLVRICQSAGTWSGHEPKCYPISCDRPPMLTHGSHYFQNNSRYISGAVPFNTSVFAVCGKGYILQGNNKTVCMGRNSWSNQGATCNIVTCKYPESFPNGVYLLKSKYLGGNVQLRKQDILTYSVQIFVLCTGGNTLTSQNTSRTCDESGDWSGETPVCAPIMCIWPLHLNGGHYMPSNSSWKSGLPYNTTLRAECDRTFKLSPSYRSRRCNETADWDNVPAVCEPLCELPNFAHVNITRKKSTLYEVGSSVRVTCINGFTLSHDKDITCRDNHTWSGIPECLALPTTEKQTSNNSAVIGSVTATVLVLLAVAVLAFFLYRRRQRFLHDKLKAHEDYTHITCRRAEQDSDETRVAFNNEYEYDTDNSAAGQSHVYNNTSLQPPTLPAVESSVTLHSDHAYYSFTGENKIPKTAIKKKNLSDFVLTNCHSKDDLEKQFKGLPQGMSEPHYEALKLQNRGKNRYKNLYAFDDTRVILKKDDASQSDYINACYVHGFSKPRKFIASQGPTEDILDDFWQMIWQEDCSKIVMLTNLIEEGKTKCEQYWPNEGSYEYGRVTVTLKSTESFSQFMIRIFTIKKDNLHKKSVTQLHFTAWPDKGVPKYASSLVQFLAKVKYTTSTGTGPTVVHCSAGVGRTGTFIALDNLTDQGNNLGYVDVAGMVTSLRKQRVSLVQTLEQYIFVHHALVESLMLPTSALPAAKFPEAFRELLQIDKEKRKTKICVEFDTLKMLSPVADECQYVSSKQVRNRQKNRYSNVLPVEEFMPALTSADASRDDNYINAVFLPSYKEQKAFIITQAPLESTRGDFWRLVWEHNVHTIVMMNTRHEIQESEVYWPNDRERATFGNIEVTNDGTEEIHKHHVLSLTIKKHLVTRYVKIIQCDGWQHGKQIPDSPEVILTLMEIVQPWQQETGNHTTLVHCMNGADKSGLFCVISAVIERTKIEQDVAISQVIEEMRNAREQIIPSVEQYRFCHETVLAFIKQYETYSNFSA